MQPKEKWGPLLKDNRKGTIYEDTVMLVDEDEWEYDFRDKLHMPHNITLTMTPAGSMVNLANVQNYTGVFSGLVCYLSFGVILQKWLSWQQYCLKFIVFWDFISG